MSTIILKTKRLILKVAQLSDLENLIALRTELEVIRYRGGFGR